MFNHSKELPLDTEVEESETPQLHVPVSETSSLDMQMEELDEPLDQIDLVEPIEQVADLWKHLRLREGLPGVEKLCMRQKSMVLHQVLSGKVKDHKGLQVM